MRESEHRSLEGRSGEGTHRRKGFCPRPGGCGVKGEKNQKPHNPIPQIPAELVGVGWGVLIRTEGETKKKQHKGHLGRGGAPCLSRAGFL